MKIKSGKIDRIPSAYSDELFRTIQSMMNLDKHKRPSVEDLMQHPQVSFRIKDQNIKDVYSGVKRKEEDILKKDKMVKEREADLDRQLKEIEEKENQLKEWEERLLAR